MASEPKTALAKSAPDHMRIWNAVSKTDPAHTKGFKRGGGFTGTAIKPMWVWQRLTDFFGPCGTGWGMERPEYQVVPGDNREVLVFCTVAGWYTENGERKFVFGEGGDKVVTHIKANEQYKRPERWENDDEAFKKAFTDALMNAFKFIGVGADVHMGLFDDSKYVADLRKEFAEPANDQPADKPKRVALEGPYTSKTALWQAVKLFDREVRSCGDLDSLEAFLAMDESKALITQLERDAPQLLHGGEGLPDEYEPLLALLSRRRTELNAPTYLNAG